MNTVKQNYKSGLIIFASPHKSGFTKRLIDDFLHDYDFNAEFEAVRAFDLSISPCIDCGGCKNGPCLYNGDGMGDLLEKISASDVIILASPIYFNGFPSPVKAIIDRCQQLFVHKMQNKKADFPPKTGILLTTAGSASDDGAECAEKSAALWFKSINADFTVRAAVKNTDCGYNYSIDDCINKIKK